MKKSTIIIIAIAAFLAFSMILGMFSDGENVSKGESASSESSDAEERTPSKGIYYTLSEEGTFYEVYDEGTCTDTDIVIASTYNGLPVKGIRKQAFSFNDTIKSVYIPNGVTYIGQMAFYGCENLENVSIPDTITHIEGENFWVCDKLNFTISDNCKYIGNQKNPFVTLVRVTDTKITSCNINSQTKVIGWNAFQACGRLTDMTIPDSVKTIEDQAFAFCSQIKNMNLGKGVESIGKEAFSNCTALTSITIPSSVRTINSRAFLECRILKSIYFESENSWHLSEYGPSSDLEVTDPTQNATNLTDDYRSYKWTRND